MQSFYKYLIHLSLINVPSQKYHPSYYSCKTKERFFLFLLFLYKRFLHHTSFLPFINVFSLLTGCFSLFKNVSKPFTNFLQHTRLLLLTNDHLPSQPVPSPFKKRSHMFLTFHKIPLIHRNVPGPP